MTNDWGRVKRAGLTEAGAIEIDEVGWVIAGAAEQERKRRICKVLHPKVGGRRADGSERNYRRSLGSLRDACYCGLQVKIRRDDSNNYPADQQHSDEFEPALHGKPL